MKKVNKTILIVSIISILIISTLGIVLPITLRSKIPEDSSLVIFNQTGNIVAINISSYKTITDKSMVMETLALLKEYNVEYFDHINVISEIDDAEKFSKNDLINSILKLGENGFQLFLAEYSIENVVGIAIDFDYYSIDIAPTIYNTLGFTDWYTEGQPINFLNSTGFSKAVIILLDGFGWTFWSNLSSLGLVNLNFTMLFNQPGLTAFPSITNVATSSILTGYWPNSTGINSRQDHTINVPTIFDVASSNNLVTEIIEGNIGFINIEADYESWLSDANNDSTNDDEIYNKTIESLNASRSDLIFVHFHGIDDIGHTYGPYSSEWSEKVNQIFYYLNDIVNYIDNETMIFLMADHGMHLNISEDDTRTGIHGESIWDDMLIPLIIGRK